MRFFDLPIAITLFICFLGASECCLNIQPGCWCSAAGLDRSIIEYYVPDNPFYSNLSHYPIKTPYIDQSGCSATVQCERGQNLVVFNKEGVVDFQDRPAQGTCHRQNQSWSVRDGSGSSEKTAEFNELFATCVDFKTFVPCFPTTPSTYLLAFSNDIDSSNMKKIVDLIQNNPLAYRNGAAPHLKTFASVRFDMETPEPIEYHKDLDDWLNSLTSKPVAARSSKNGSDIFNILSQFLDNKDAPVCGARINIILKRQPVETEVMEMVKRLRDLRVEVSIITIAGGEYPETMLKVATKTHGIGVYMRRGEGISKLNNFLWVFLVYSADIEVFGENSTSLHSMDIKQFGSYLVNVVIQDHVPLNTFQSFELDWSNEESELHYNFNMTMAGLPVYLNTTDIENASVLPYAIRGLQPAQYATNFKYKYNSSAPEYARIRVYKFLDVDSWVPYND